MHQPIDIPRIRLVPPVYFAIWIVVGSMAGLVLPQVELPVVVAQAWGWTFFTLAVLLNLWTVGSFKRAGTPLHVRRPARTFIGGGPFRLSRNPLYLSMAMCTVGFSFIAGTYWVALTLPLFIALFNRLVIAPEESYLANTFGDEYLAYARSVRRWV